MLSLIRRQEMDKREIINAAQRMQDYIHTNITEDITLENICDAGGFSKRHAFRIFKDVFGKTPFEYIRALRLTIAARSIQNNSGTISNIPPKK